MTNDFNWQTDDNNAWEEGADGTPPDSAGATLTAWLKRRWRWLGLAAVLLTIIGVATYSLFNRQVEKVEDTTIAGVLAAHNLVRQAAHEKDFELLAVLMADNGRNWNQMQLELLNIDLFLDRRPLHLTLVTDTVSVQAAPPQVTVSPDLQTAELLEQIPYQVEDNGQTILLEQTFYYQRRGDSWLLTSPPEGSPFLDDSQTIEMEYLTIVYPQEEEEFVSGYLAQKMDELVGRICEDNTVECPPGLKIELRLQSDPSSLRFLNFNIFGLSLNDVGTGEFEFSLLSPIYLPSAIVVGRPIDEAGREALYHGYANWLAATMVSSFTEAQLDRDTLEDKLAVWGLEPPPEPLIALPLPQPIPDPPIPFPEQDILLACSSPTFKMLRYNPRTNSWLDELRDSEAVYLSSDIQQIGGVVVLLPLNDDSGVLVRLDHYFPDENPFKIILWRDGQERMFLESSFLLQLLSQPAQQQFDPSGRNIVIYDNDGSQSAAQGFERLIYGLNIQACISGNCQYRNYNGFPYWSPDLSWALVADADEQSFLTLWNEETDEQIPLGRGFSPFWLNKDEFGYILPTEPDPNADSDRSASVQVVAASVEEPLQNTVLIDSADIAVLTGDNPTLPVTIQPVIAHPIHSTWLFLVAITRLQNGRDALFLLSYRRDTDELTVSLDLNDSRLTAPPDITSDGQYFILPTFGTHPGATFRSNSLSVIPLQPTDMSIGVPLERYDVTAGFVYDWSHDGRWLLAADPDQLHLIAPGNNYNHSIPHELGFCTGVAWINS